MQYSMKSILSGLSVIAYLPYTMKGVKFGFKLS